LFPSFFEELAEGREQLGGRLLVESLGVGRHGREPTGGHRARAGAGQIGRVRPDDLRQAAHHSGPLLLGRFGRRLGFGHAAHGSVVGVIVDSYRFLPRSFIPLYSGAAPAPGDDGPVWAPFEKRLSGAQIALLTSAGLYLEGEQEPFDGEREKAEPTWGDPTHRVLPARLPDGALGMMHLHVNSEDVLADPEIALPLGGLAELVGEGRVGGVAPSHFSVMGYQQAGLEVWRRETAPAIVERLRDEGTDGLILAPV
jgi:D-proline reductase (dithiol) PrdB